MTLHDTWIPTRRINEPVNERKQSVAPQFNTQEMRPDSWIEAITGTCCLLVALWLAPMFLRGLFQLDPYVQRGFGTIMEYTGFVSGSLLLGSVGAVLLTGKNREHRGQFHRIWLVVATLVTISLVLAWTSLSTAP